MTGPTRIAACVALAGAAAVMAAGPAAAAPASVSINGNMQVMGLSVLHVEAQAQGDGPATGTYAATGQFGNAPLPLKVTGPVTCLRVVGDTVSLVYPITTSQPVMLFAPDEMAIQVTVTKGRNGAPNMIGYGAPMPTNTFRDCQPGPTPAVFDGTIDIN
ncbi:MULTISPECIES: hypothetical protein [Nocardia]|uniref:DUF4402 domain-containing protein n=1 Tax=Nocardia sputorum TaxID=2984338 RepID=A0ABN6U585_9NOCA|nr:hypothetical protein [Nocardia sputorum]BDT91858.1 hypothetical protein IFM12275_18340 [Nocardia sputorum]BDU00387.1 hypothetical protein IFM12276_34150 [Nocardia sputorum]